MLKFNLTSLLKAPFAIKYSVLFLSLHVCFSVAYVLGYSDRSEIFPVFAWTLFDSVEPAASQFGVLVTHVNGIKLEEPKTDLHYKPKHSPYPTVRKVLWKAFDRASDGRDVEFNKVQKTLGLPKCGVSLEIIRTIVKVEPVIKFEDFEVIRQDRISLNDLSLEDCDAK
ncbi:MAG: hypothetical protein HRT45_02160 [Bdellovibrionales bacterium]|nr:hypothetical protein [Bdellovibrionales bacterium]